MVAESGGTGAGVTNGYDSRHTIRAEGRPVLNTFQASATRQYDEAVLAEIVVIDGNLDIDAIGGLHTKLSYLEVYRMALTLVTPAVPANLQTFIMAEDVSVTWDAAADAVSYKVFRGSTAQVDTSTAPLSAVENPTYTDLSTVAGSTYYYAAIATSRDAVDSAASAVVSAVVPVIEEPVLPQLCPTGTWKAEFFAGTALAGQPIVTRCVTSIDQNFASHCPSSARRRVRARSDTTSRSRTVRT